MITEVLAALDFAQRLAAEAGGALLAQRSSVQEMQLFEKSSTTDVATAADIAIEALIVETIRATYPHDAILTEEGSIADNPRATRRWIVDPLDGTANFRRDLWPYAISIALEIEGDLTVGAIYDPIRNDLYAAATGHGVYRDGRQITRPASVRPALRESFIGLSGTNRSGEVELRASLLATLATTVDSVRDLGSTAMHVCLVANGTFDAHIALHVQPWDIAAGLVIVREAGCVITPLNDDLPQPIPSSALIANPYVHDELLAIIERDMQA